MTSMIPGQCYKTTRDDGAEEVFLFFGVNGAGQGVVEIPPDSGNLLPYDRLFPGGYRSCVIVDRPKGEPR
jgi:hypothetical protein